MTGVQSQYPPTNYFMLPDTAAAQNAVALFIFTIPMGTLSQDLFVNPIYRSVRNTIAKRCKCELAVYDGNTMLQRSHSGPRSTKSRVRNVNVNASFGSEPSQATTGLLINITNIHEQVLFARGNWLIQVNYLTEPSEHYLFLKLVDDFATRLNSSGGFKRGIGTSVISQGFKFTTLVVLTHDKLRHAFQCNNLTSGGQRKQQESSGEEKDKIPTPDVILSPQNLPREWGESPTIQKPEDFKEDEFYLPVQNKFDGLIRSQSLGPPQQRRVGARQYQSGDLISEEMQKSDRYNEKVSQERGFRFEEIESFLKKTERNHNHQFSEEFASNYRASSDDLEMLGAEEDCRVDDEQLDALFKATDSLQNLEQEIAELENMVNS